MELRVVATIMLIAGMLLCGMSIVAWRRIHAPAIEPFSIMAGVMGSGGLGLAWAMWQHEWRLVLALIVGLGMILPIVWFWFAMQYIGKAEFATPKNLLLIAFPLILGLLAWVVVLIDGWVAFVSIPASHEASGGIAIAVTMLNLIYWFGLLYAGGLLLAGSGSILWVFERYHHLDSTMGIVLGTFGTLPWVTILFGLQLETVSIVVTTGIVSFGLLASAIAAGLLVGPYPLFVRVPSAGSIGPRTIIEELADLVVVTDREGTVVEMNESAMETLVGADRMLGQPIESVLNVSLAELSERDVLDLESTHGRVLVSPTVSPLSDQHDQLLGYGIVLRDTTAQVTRRQLLEVFNRVLRHNLRNEMNIVLGRTDVIRSQANDPVITESADVILERGEEVSGLAEKVREAERVLAIPIEHDWATSIDALVEDILARVPTEKAVVVRNDIPEGAVVTAPEEMVELVLRNLVENAIEHHDDDRVLIAIGLESTGNALYPLELTVRDDGPGIAAPERRVIEEGSETPLEHGSGLGLWIVRLVITRLGGTIAFVEREPRGTEVRISLPAQLTVAAHANVRPPTS